jgi:sugar lactone lactonase YvrE
MAVPVHIDTVDVFDERRCRLGESPYYDARTDRAYWVDILGAQLMWRARTGGEYGQLPTGAHVGAAVPTENDEVVLCLPAGPVLVSGDGDHIRPLGTYAEADAVAGVAGASQPIRSNDAKADRAGRLWLGTMAYAETPGAGALYRLDPGGRRPLRIRGNVTISNGIAWSPDDRTMYYVDSPTGRIDAFDYDLGTGTFSAPRVFAVIDRGHPDGLCVDAEGGVWVALWDGGAVRRYHPGGTVDRTVAVPTPRVTSCAFIGPDLDRLLVTTASVGRADDPQAGLTYVYVCQIPGLATGRVKR